ncbi:MAG: TatD family hydrolase [Desulfovibrionaceae bacterium]|nr:TatD family hydrolase [Desulfovibrionaceae bacterium]
MSQKNKSRPAPWEAGLPLGGVDSHAHLDMPGAFAESVPETLERARKAGLARVGNVFLGPKAYADNVRLFDGQPDVFFLLGIHPGDAAKAVPGDLAAMEQAFRADARLAAIGEIGLDFYWDAAPCDVQAQLFADQLALAKELGKPVAVHCRDAYDETMAILADAGYRDRPLLWHCFGGDETQAREILSHGWTISIPGPVTYAKNAALRQAAAAIDLTRLLLETDCPYLAPEPYRGKRNEPAYLVFTALAVAALKNLDPAVVWRTTGDNARRFFGV